MGSIPLRIIAMFAATFVGQVAGIALLPRTHGFTRPFATIGCIAVLVFSFWMIARLLNSGVSLVILLPLIAATVPLGAVAVGITLYGEAASVLKVAVLVVACGLVGLASRMG
jgi:multidrug transporter EmrE-like cation transporter